MEPWAQAICTLLKSPTGWLCQMRLSWHIQPQSLDALYSTCVISRQIQFLRDWISATHGKTGSMKITV